MTVSVETEEEWVDYCHRLEYLGLSPVGRFLLNRERRLWGRPPLTLRECKAWRAEQARANAEAYAELKRRRSAQNR